MPSEMKKIYHHCIEEIKKDSANMQKIQTQYNLLSGKINDDIHHALRFDQIPLINLVGG